MEWHRPVAAFADGARMSAGYGGGLVSGHGGLTLLDALSEDKDSRTLARKA